MFPVTIPLAKTGKEGMAGLNRLLELAVQPFALLRWFHMGMMVLDSTKVSRLKMLLLSNTINTL